MPTYCAHFPTQDPVDKAEKKLNKSDTRSQQLEDWISKDDSSYKCSLLMALYKLCEHRVKCLTVTGRIHNIMTQKPGTHEDGQSQIQIKNRLFKKAYKGQSMASMLDLPFHVIQGHL